MKKTWAILILLLLGIVSVNAQSEKPMVDSKGHIYKGRTKIGHLTEHGGHDESGKPVTQINKDGKIVDINGKVLGKVAKGSTFKYYFNDKEEEYAIGKASHTGMCEVKNSKGETVMLLHKNYKKEAACAIHCLYENKCMPEH